MKRRTDHHASYKDPSAKVFYYEDEQDNIYRELHPSYLPHYHQLNTSGLAAELIKKNWLVSFEEIKDHHSETILKAKKIQFVSYPYEWTFNQWKDAALLTLKIQFQALKFGMILKDASPFNIVFDGARPIFIDISSFEIFEVGKPWQAYKQFCECFYMPLLLAKYFGEVGNEIFLNNINGISLSKGLSLLPAKAHFNLNTLFYLALPDKMRKQVKNSDNRENKISESFTQKKSMQFAEQLFSNINKIKQAKKITKWNSYYDEDKIDANYLQEKEGILKEWFSNYSQKTLIDFGCNTGKFSKLLSPHVKTIFAFDDDINCVDQLYTHCREDKINNIFSFSANITHPTPAVGFNNRERQSLLSRLKGDAGLALALIHHLVFNNNLNFTMIAEMFAATCTELVIEFITKEDDKVRMLLSTRKDIFDWYNFENFVMAFETKFTLVKTHCFANHRMLIHFIKNKNEQ